jgi:hypothetical protein
MKLRLEERVFGVDKWLLRFCTCKKWLDKPKQDLIDDINLKTRGESTRNLVAQNCSSKGIYISNEKSYNRCGLNHINQAYDIGK